MNTKTEMWVKKYTYINKKNPFALFFWEQHLSVDFLGVFADVIKRLRRPSGGTAAAAK